MKISLLIFSSLIAFTLCNYGPKLDLNLVVENGMTLGEIYQRRDIMEKMLEGDVKELFTTYHQMYKKPYDLTSEEGLLKFKVFAENVENIKRHNSDPTNSWKIGIDQFSDLSKSEFRSKVLADPEKVKEKRLKANYFNLSGLNVVEYVTKKEDVNIRPIDWSSKTGKTYDQNPCGCCYSMSTTNAIETNYAIATGQPYVALSRQQNVDCNIYTYGCDGGDTRLVVGYSNIYGLISDALYPFAPRVGQCKYDSNKSLARKVVNGMEIVYTPIDKYSCSKHGLFDTLTRGVVVVHMDGEIANGYKSGVLDAKYKCRESNHAVLLVGYGVEKGTEYWLIKNSWGYDHGINGYIKIKVYDDPSDPIYNCYIQCDYVRPFWEASK